MGKIKNIFRLAFNTGFINSNLVTFKPEDLDPDSVKKKSKFADLQVTI